MPLSKYISEMKSTIKISRRSRELLEELRPAAEEQSSKILCLVPVPQNVFNGDLVFPFQPDSCFDRSKFSEDFRVFHAFVVAMQP